MGLDSSRSLRIKVLLLIDTAFFFLELIVGYSVGSLALVADSFHMLNDVCSLLVALYAIKLAGNSKRSHEYSYGWQRAEVLGALINGVFLLALCFSIFLEAIQRVFDPINISSPPLVVLVGSLGLASNIVGLLLFHEHGHAHGGGHSHHAHSRSHSHSEHLPVSSHSENNHQHLPTNLDQRVSQPGPTDEHTPLLTPASAPSSSPMVRQPSSSSISSYDSSSTGTISPKPDKRQSLICVHPAQTRNNILRAAELQRDQLTHHHSSARTQPLPKADITDNLPTQPTSDPEASHPHHHSSHSHSHSHMNMRAIFLHALGDALGNVGVIVTGLLIWLVPTVDRHGNAGKNGWIVYADPTISLVITGIIFTSALPLVRSASLILLQGTPSHVNLGRVQKSLEAIKGVLQVHELHIWSLSELKLVASVHVLIKNQDDFVTISRHIRKCLHHYGIHSSTIQPEILLEEQVNSLRAMSTTSSASPPARSRPASTPTTDVANLIDVDGCLQQCDETCDQEACCPPGSVQPRIPAGDSTAP
ncbi:hypothetical protein PGT21_001513 [Puccinia graminis f. sp. tritici]|uniref:CDF family cation efflux system protein n=1 Tax=Puccinia graminis f. sp. tritici TaxID=56615 RepID=A0A5B0QDZ0_PUCGR|nr:hypothetical protein PGT21_001513 [Puccinia graminis f. sp. tritici]KAA1111371.1 hypothetical protein PGTUg99_003391 [Puccinia graminis f. sp. tritici]